MAFLVQLLGLVLLAGCTTAGMVEKKAIRPLDRAEPQPFRICIYKDVSIADERVRDIVAAMRDEFAPFGIRIDVPWVRDWRRPSFFMKGILQDIGNRPLESPCDRIFGIVGRDMKDFVWGIFMPEVLGVVDTKTLAKGYSVGEWGSLNHALTFRNPEELAVHEVYHLLGCAHGLSTQPCGDQIDEIVERARENRQRGEDFFPSRGLDGRYFRTRSEVDSYLGLKVVAEPERVSLSPRDEERSLR